MKPAAPTVIFAVRTAKGERRRIRSFLKQVQELGVQIEDLPKMSVKALTEADKFLGRYLDLLARETPTPAQLEGVMEALGGIDKVVKNAMAEVLRSLGWRPDDLEGRDGAEAADPPPTPAKSKRTAGTVSPAKGGKLIRFPGPRVRKPS